MKHRDSSVLVSLKEHEKIFCGQHLTPDAFRQGADRFFDLCLASRANSEIEVAALGNFLEVFRGALVCHGV